MFLVNSRLGRFTAAPSGFQGVNPFYPTGAPLLPKLRGHFAEFLNEGSSDRLGILYLPTCVGLGTGTPRLPRRFSRRHGFRDFPHFWGGLPVSGLRTTDLPIVHPTRLPQVDHRLGSPILPRPAIGDSGGYVVPEYQPVGHRLRLSASA